MSDRFVMYADNHDEFAMWQGLKGPYFTPSVDEEGNLSWTNNGGLANPQTVNITGPAGASFTIAGIVEQVSDLPAVAEGVWLVGTAAPYEGYSQVNGVWEDIGQFAIGPKGDTGDPGATGEAAGFGTPTATVNSSVGTPAVSVTASGPDTAKVFAFAFSNLKGETGEQGTSIDSVTLASGTHAPGTSDTYNVNLDDSTVAGQFTVYNGADGQGSPGTSTPLADSGAGVVGTDNAYSRQDHQHPLNVPSSGTPSMDGTASRGSASTYARFDHVHPTDTSRAAQTDMTTAQGNITSLQTNKADKSGFKGFTVTLSSASWSNNAQTVNNANFLSIGYSYIVSPASASFTDYGTAQIYADDVSTDGQMTFHCSSAPSSNLTVNVVMVVAT